MSFTIRKEEGMSGLNKLCEDIRMFLWILLVVGSLGELVTNLTDFGKDSTDGIQRSGMALRHDALTGCDYLESRKGHLIPRLDNSGKTCLCEAMKSKRAKYQNVLPPSKIDRDEFLLAALIRFTERGYQGEVSGVYIADLVIMLDMGVDRGEL